MPAARLRASPTAAGRPATAGSVPVRSTLSASDAPSSRSAGTLDQPPRDRRPPSGGNQPAWNQESVQRGRKPLDQKRMSLDRAKAPASPIAGEADIGEVEWRGRVARSSNRVAIAEPRSTADRQGCRSGKPCLEGDAPGRCADRQQLAAASAERSGVGGHGIDPASPSRSLLGLQKILCTPRGYPPRPRWGGPP